MNFIKLAVIVLTALTLSACKNSEKSTEETAAHPALEIVEVDTSNSRFGNYRGQAVLLCEWDG